MLEYNNISFGTFAALSSGARLPTEIRTAAITKSNFLEIINDYLILDTPDLRELESAPDDCLFLAFSGRVSFFRQEKDDVLNFERAVCLTRFLNSSDADACKVYVASHIHLD